MGSGQAHRAAESAAPHLTPGEQITATGFGSMGQVSLGKNVAIAVVVGIVSLGHVMAFQRPKRAYYALTNQRLLAFDGERLLGRPGRMLFSLPLRAARIVRSSKNFVGVVRVDLAIEGQPKGLRISFAPGSQQAGEAVIAAIKSIGGVHASEAIEAGPATRQPAYASPQPPYASPQPGYGSPQPAYGSAQPAYGSPQANFQDPLQDWHRQQPQRAVRQPPQQDYVEAPQQPPWDRQPQPSRAEQLRAQQAQAQAQQAQIQQSRRPRTLRVDKRPTEEWKAPENW